MFSYGVWLVSSVVSVYVGVGGFGFWIFVFCFISFWGGMGFGGLVLGMVGGLVGMGGI